MERLAVIPDEPFGKLINMSSARGIAIVLLAYTGAGLAAELVPGGGHFVGSEVCAECHAEEFNSWQISHHASAMLPANDRSVSGDFSDAILDTGGHKAQFFRRGSEYWVRFELPGTPSNELRIDYTFGLTPLQQYMVSLPDGRKQFIPYAWDARSGENGGQRWFILYPDATVSDEYYWRNAGQNWNFMCADCHSTNVRKNYSPATDSYSTDFSEINVACEACHGPASIHLALVDKGKQLPDGAGFDRSLAKAVQSWKTGGDEPTSRPGKRIKSEQLVVCAQCHSRRQQLVGLPASPQHFADRHRLSLIAADLYQPDGSLLEETFVYGSFLQSRMYQQGVVCTDCHDPHSSRLRYEGDAICTQCHQPQVFQSSEHHLHSQNSVAARCTTCHMPETLYMQVDWRADHSFKVPRPDLSERIGTRDVCSSCHSDKTPEWAAQAINAFETPRRAAQSRAAIAFHQADTGRANASASLKAIAADPRQSAIIRASALARLSGASDLTAKTALESSVRDGNWLVRRGVAKGTVGLSAEDRWQILQPLLTDPILSVRLEAVEALISDWAEFDEDRKASLQDALAEYLEVQRFNSDRASARVNIGNVYMYQSRAAEAASEYRAAIELEPGFAPAYVNLADLLANSDRNEEAIALLKKGAQGQPRSAEVRFALGLAEVRANRMSVGRGWLQSASELSPDNAYYHFVYGLAQEDVDLDAALASMQRAYELSGSVPYLLSTCEVAARNQHPSSRACINALEGRVSPQTIVRLRRLLSN